MRFTQKLTLLICCCVLVVGILCLIQYHLVQNTYRLERALYIRQLEERLEDKAQRFSDSLNSGAMRALLAQLQGQIKLNQRISLTGFQQQLDSTLTKYRGLIDQALQNDTLLKNVGYSLAYTEILLHHAGHTDTLLQGKAPPLLLTGNGRGDFLLDAGKQMAGFKLETTGRQHTPAYARLEVWNRPMITAADWHPIVLGRMFATLIGSAILIAALVLIFYLIFSALFRQKKIAEVTTDFANNMTHELKTPLSAAILVAKSLRTPDAKLDEEWFQELLEQLDRQHGRIQRLMDNVMTSALDRSIAQVKFRLHHLDKTLAELNMLANAAGRQMIFTGQLDLLIFTDPDLLGAILSNLLDNAIKYTPAGPPVKLHVQRIGTTVMISLEDHGPGIHKKFQRLLFRKFFRVPRADIGQIKGLGLGLYLSRIQAQQLNGRLTYEPSSTGGSIFNLILPYEKDTPTAG